MNRFEALTLPGLGDTIHRMVHPTGLPIYVWHMEGAASTFSALMLSRWGMEALGSSCDLNELPLRLQEEMPLVPIPHDPDDAFEHDLEHLLVVWLIMLAFIIVPIVIGNFGLHRVKKDSRD